jgi:NAD+ synthase (glutamine-hydrolysing)
MKIAICQINTTIGDFPGNVRAIRRAARRAEQDRCDLALFPELAVCGYPPRDLLERESFLRETEKATEQIARSSRQTTLVFGTVIRNPRPGGKPLFNAAAVARHGRVRATYAKCLLPTYDVFDEGRYFESGGSALIIPVCGQRVGITICEDIWNDKTFWMHPIYPADPVEDLARRRAHCLVNIAASPWALGKDQFRAAMISRSARRFRLPFVGVNLIGGNDSLIFDGASFACDARGRPLARGRSFEEDFYTVSLPGGGPLREPEPEMTQLRRALVLGLRDYFSKCGFQSAVLGLSGGVDSAVTAALAVEALGPGRVTGVAMPGPYSSSGSLADAREVARRLQMPFLEIPIGDVYQSFLAALAPAFAGRAADVTEENLQARIRGTLLMALSNKMGSLVLSTGNKSELAVGYCTLYGDMNGGLAVISDVPKTLVYALAHEINRESALIPESTLTKPPSAELAAGQLDSDSLPPYEALDPLLEALVSDSLPAAAAAKKAHVSVSVAREILRKIDRNEYKRRQMAIGLKVTRKAFGEGRRYPVAQKFRV